MTKNKKQYDLIVSIGDTCACSSFLRRNKLQYASYPLDWVGLNPFENKIELLTHHFADFMNIEDLERLEEQNNIHCYSYVNKRSGSQIYHDFPVDVPFEEAFPIVQQKYQRRIERLYQRIDKAENILFIWFSPHVHLSEETLLSGQQELARFFAPKKINLLIIEDDKTTENIKETHISEFITKITYNMFKPSSQGEVSKVMGNLALGDQIFSQYKLKTPWWFNMANKLIQNLPNRSLRKKLRNRLYNY